MSAFDVNTVYHFNSTLFAFLFLVLGRVYKKALV